VRQSGPSPPPQFLKQHANGLFIHASHHYSTLIRRPLFTPLISYPTNHTVLRNRCRRPCTPSARVRPARPASFHARPPCLLGSSASTSHRRCRSTSPSHEFRSTPLSPPLLCPSRWSQCDATRTWMREATTVIPVHPPTFHRHSQPPPTPGADDEAPPALLLSSLLTGLLSLSSHTLRAPTVPSGCSTKCGRGGVAPDAHACTHLTALARSKLRRLLLGSLSTRVARCLLQFTVDAAPHLSLPPGARVRHRRPASGRPRG
jgi:hypothetical protein